MYPTSDMSNPPFNNIPPIWFVRRREYLETSFQEILNLREKLTMFSGGNNVIKILDGVELLRELYSQVDEMESTISANKSHSISEHNTYNKYELQRIKELSSSTANHLDALARQIRTCPKIS